MKKILSFLFPLGLLFSLFLVSLATPSAKTEVSPSPVGMVSTPPLVWTDFCTDPPPGPPTVTCPPGYQMNQTCLGNKQAEWATDIANLYAIGCLSQTGADTDYVNAVLECYDIADKCWDDCAELGEVYSGPCRRDCIISQEFCEDQAYEDYVDAMDVIETFMQNSINALENTYISEVQAECCEEEGGMLSSPLAEMAMNSTTETKYWREVDWDLVLATCGGCWEFIVNGSITTGICEPGEDTCNIHFRKLDGTYLAGYIFECGGYHTVVYDRSYGDCVLIINN